MINFTRLKVVLEEVDALVEDLDGKDLDETAALTSQSKGEARQLRAQMSQDLQLLASRLELSAQLVKIEFWNARGEGDPLEVGRDS
jgi:hypothetical protein